MSSTSSIRSSIITSRSISNNGSSVRSIISISSKVDQISVAQSAADATEVRAEQRVGRWRIAQSEGEQKKTEAEAEQKAQKGSRCWQSRGHFMPFSANGQRKKSHLNA